MSIYKQDNKIISNLSGEILTEPPLIDISSDYGVAKDGSNLVSSVKDRTQPVKFLSPVGKQPIENGDGFEYSTTTNMLYTRQIDYIEYPTFEFWFKITGGSTGNRQIIGIYDIADSSSQFYMYIPSNGIFKVQSITVGGGLYLDQLIGIPLALPQDVTMHCICYGYKINSNPYLSIYIDGKAYLSKYSIVPNPSIAKSPLTLGNIYNYSQGFKGSIYGLKVGKPIIPKLENGKAASTSTYTYGEQVFTPPTFPNTIL